MHKITVIGAGKTGRGFVGRLLAEAGAEIVFVDRDAGLVNRLNGDGGFQVHFFGDSREPVRISHYRANLWEDADFSDTELILVSVGGSNLREVGTQLRSRLEPDRPYYLITCENAANPAQLLQDAIGLPKVRVSEATVFCTTIEGEGCDILSEDYPYLQFDAARLDGYIPPVAAIQPVENFGNFLTRKLFTYNAASCIAAYMGWFYGYTDYGAAANDSRVLAMMDRNYAASNQVLCQAFGYDPADQEAFALLSRRKFCDRTIADTVARNAREPQRKLGAKERIIGPMQLLRQYGADYSALTDTAAVMLFYDAPGELRWREIKAQYTPAEILEQYSGLDRENPLAKEILERYKVLKADYDRRKS